MKTHFYWGLGLSSYISYFLINDTSELYWILLGPIFGFIALMPDLLDNYATRRYNLYYGGAHYRDPLTHAPWTISYFIALAVLLPSSPVISFFLLQCTIAWFSHLFLDILNPVGIPLFFQPALKNADVKHYSWKKTNHGTARLSIGNIHYDNHYWNNFFTSISTISYLIILNLSVIDLVMF